MLTLRLLYIDYRILSIPSQEASQRGGAGPQATSKEQRLGGCWPKLKRVFGGTRWRLGWAYLPAIGWRPLPRPGSWTDHYLPPNLLFSPFPSKHSPRPGTSHLTTQAMPSCNKVLLLLPSLHALILVFTRIDQSTRLSPTIRSSAADHLFDFSGSVVDPKRAGLARSRAQNHLCHHVCTNSTFAPSFGVTSPFKKFKFQLSHLDHW